MIKRITTISALSFLMMAAMSTAAFAGPCDSFGSYARKIKAGYDKACKNKSNAKVCKSDTAFTRTTSDVLRFWASIAGNGAGKIGARTIKLGQSLNGTVIAPGDRTWVTASPSPGAATVAITKKGGKARLRVNVCAIDPKTGKSSLLTSRDVSGSYKTSARVKGKFILVRMDGKLGKGSKVGNKFQYSIRIK